MVMIPTYEAVFNETTKGVFGISLVENPATQEYFITLSAQEKKALKEKEIKFATIDLEQRILLGLVLEPDMPIYRNQDGEEFNIIFNSQTVKDLAHSFISNGYQHNSSIEHSDEKIKGIAFVESWTVEDQKRDKSNAYGLEYKKGSWLIAMKVSDESTWNDYVKTGKVKGFSIDAIVKLKEVQTNKNVNMSLADNLKKYLGLSNDEPKVEVKLGQVAIEDGSVLFEYEGEVMEVGASVFALDPSDPENKIPVPVGKYPLEDGSTMVVNEEGIIAEIMPKVGEEQPMEPAAAPPAIKQEMPLADVKDTVNDIKSILIKYEEMEKLLLSSNKEQSERMLKLEELVGKMAGEVSTVKNEVVQMSEQPVQKPKTSMATIALNKEGRILEKIRNNKN